MAEDPMGSGIQKPLRSRGPREAVDGHTCCPRGCYPARAVFDDKADRGRYGEVASGKKEKVWKGLSAPHIG